MTNSRSCALQTPSQGHVLCVQHPVPLLEVSAIKVVWSCALGDGQRFFSQSLCELGEQKCTVLNNELFLALDRVEVCPVKVHLAS